MSDITGCKQADEERLKLERKLQQVQKVESDPGKGSLFRVLLPELE